MKTALIIGATGLVGSHLLDLLLLDRRFDRVKSFSRRSLVRNDPKLEEHVVDFEKIPEWANHLTGEVLFSALGTTLKQAGSKDAQYKVDYTMQYEVALHAAANGVKTLVLVSSAGAATDSWVFYSKMKGELEVAVKKMSFDKIRIIQPGILDGMRKETRAMEKTAIDMMSVLGNVPFLKKYRPVHAETVARSMINACFDEPAGVKVYTLEEVFSLAAKGAGTT